MRPIQLEMCAFGPFKDTQIVDFQKLGENPLFLINGQTGSGKTTILDAICFALYGSATGVERDVREMRCHLSDPKVETYVNLTFSLGQTTYLVERKPEQEVQKKRGDGFTKKSSDAALYEIGQEKKLIANRTKEVSQFIEDLTGLSVVQFRQVMVLPQGKFRELLIADSKDREQIFSKLFQTYFYSKIEKDLDFKAKDIRVKRKEFENKIVGSLETLSVESLDELQKLTKDLAPELESLFKDREEKKDKFKQCEKEYQSALVLDKNITDLSKTEIELKNLQLKKDTIDKSQAAIIEIEQALDLSSDYTSYINLENKSSQDLVSFEEISDLFKELALKKEEFSKQYDNKEKLEKEVEDLSAKRETLARYYELQLSVNKESRDVEIKTKEREKLLSELEKDNEKNSNLIIQFEELNEKKKSLSTYFEANKKEDLLKYEFSLKEKKSTFEKIDRLNTDIHNKNDHLVKIENETLKQKESVDKATKHLKELQLKWHRAQASLLAKDLQENTPCPVCGSKDHPEPATIEEKIPSESEIQECERILQKELADLARLETQVTALKKDIEELSNEKKAQQELLDSLSIEEYQKQMKDITSRLSEFEEFEKNSKKLQSDLEALSLKKEALQKERETIVIKESKLASEIELLNKGIDDKKEKIPSEYDGLESIKEKGLEVKSLLDQKKNDLILLEKEAQEINVNYAKALENRTLREQELQKTRAQLKEAKEIWLSKFSKSTFESENHFSETLNKKSMVEQLRSDVQSYKTQLKLLESSKVRLEEEIKGKEKPDLGSLEAKLSALEEASIKSFDLWSETKRRFDSLTDGLKKLEGNLKTLDSLEHEYKVIGTLADVANGRVGNKISLQRFVLSVLLDDVLLEGSHRLKLMSKGRYELIRKLDRAKGNKASGLEIEINDMHTGRMRSVSTLSGGESFMAALALALGLSDVVQAYSGGIKLDTLFIDEGFGSLDPESLDLALRTLIDLQSSGRMIGLISHVESLKEQMSKRIDVRASKEGSQVQVISF